MTSDELQRIIKRKMDSQSEKECKGQYLFIVTSLSCFLNDLDHRILDADTNKDDIPGLFFKLAINLGTEALAAQVTPGGKKKFEKKFEPVTKLWPVLRKFAEADDVAEFTEIPADQKNLPAQKLELGSGNE